MKKIAMILLLGVLLTSCGSNNDDSEGSDDSTGSGGYLNCVLEYYQLRNEGVISATDAEIQSECSSSSLP